MAGSHAFDDHTGEVLLHVEADSLPELFAEAGRALAELQGGDFPPGPPAEPEAVELRSTDLEALLVDWLDELIYRGERGHRIYRELRVTRVEAHGLSATLRGDAADALKTAVKAATYHRLRIAETPRGVEATVILDV